MTNNTNSGDAKTVRDVRELYRYIWKVSARRQVILSALAVAVFLLELAPLELQRRIVNGAVDKRDFQFIGMLCLIYVAVALLYGGLKFTLNVMRGSVGEAANRRLRMQMTRPFSLSVPGWLLQGRTEVGTIVAFISELALMNYPWRDLVTYFRDLTNAGLKYRMINAELDQRSAEHA